MDREDTPLSIEGAESAQSKECPADFCPIWEDAYDTSSTLSHFLHISANITEISQKMSLK